MDKIRSQHKLCIYLVFGVTASIWFYILFNYPGSTSKLGNLQWFGITWTAVAALLVLLYEKWGWRWINPQFNFVGEWDFTEEQYTLDRGSEEDQFVYEASGSMRIVQDVRSISVVEGQTFRTMDKAACPSGKRQIAVWRSLACNLNDTATVIWCALGHESSPGRKGGAVMYAIEIISVMKRDHRGRPAEMSSVVYHCVGSGTPHLVKTNYQHKNRKASIDLVSPSNST